MELLSHGECRNGYSRRTVEFAMLLLVVSSGCGHNVIDPGPVSTRPSSRVTQINSSAGTAPTHLEQVPVSQVITLPRRDSPAKYHEVKSGETLSGIARGHGVSLQRLLDANGLESSTALHPGVQIYIPSNR